MSTQPVGVASVTVEDGNPPAPNSDEATIIPQYTCSVTSVSYKSTTQVSTWGGAPGGVSVNVIPPAASQPTSQPTFTISGLFPVEGYYKLGLSGGVTYTDTKGGSYPNTGGTATAHAFFSMADNSEFKLQDPTWGQSASVSADDNGQNGNPLPPTTMPAGTRTEGTSPDGLGGVKFSLSNMEAGVYYDWAVYTRNPTNQVSDDTVHGQPASGKFSTTQASSAQMTYLSPGAYSVVVTKEGDSAYIRQAIFDLIGIYMTFAAMPTTAPPTQSSTQPAPPPNEVEKTLGGYTMLDTTQPTTDPSGGANATVMLQGPAGRLEDVARALRAA
jgi:hypothetical protein